MKIIQKNWYFFMVLSICFSQEVLPLTQRYFHTEDMGYDYSRGTYLIVLADASLESIIRDEEYGNFVKFKQTQGYNVVIQNSMLDGMTGLFTHKLFMQKILCLNMYYWWEMLIIRIKYQLFCLIHILMVVK